MCKPNYAVIVRQIMPPLPPSVTFSEHSSRHSGEYIAAIHRIKRGRRGASSLTVRHYYVYIRCDDQTEKGRFQGRGPATTRVSESASGEGHRCPVRRIGVFRRARSGSSEVRNE